MSTNINKYGSSIVSREFLVAPITSLDTQIQTNYFSYPELDANGVPTGVTLYHSVRSHNEGQPGDAIRYTADGLYFFYGMFTSDLKNDTKDMKTFVKTAGLKLGTEDFTAMVGDEFWVLNPMELDEWLVATPHNEVVV